MELKNLEMQSKKNTRRTKLSINDICNDNQNNTDFKLKMKNVEYSYEENENNMNIDIEYTNSNHIRNNNNNTNNMIEKDDYISRKELIRNNNNNNDIENITASNKSKENKIKEESKITQKILKNINKEQKQLKNSLSKKMKNLISRERLIEKNKKEIEKCYFNNQRGFCTEYCLKDQCFHLSRFTNYFNKFSQYTQFRAIASIDYADNFLNNSSCIVSAVEFDKNDDLFASAGVLKKIRIYDFNNVVFNYRDLYRSEGKNAFENSIYQDNEHKQQRRHGKFSLNNEEQPIHFPSSSSSSSNHQNNLNLNRPINNDSVSNAFHYMSTLPNKVPLSSILLNPEIKICSDSIDNISYNSNHSSSSYESFSDSEDSYTSPNNLDYITRYPIQEIICNSKISCLSYSYGNQRNLLSSDYEGIITLWDTERGTAISIFDEHEKRAWCVDYNVRNPTQFASGSDDSTVKIWNENVPYSTLTIDSRVNICSVAFNPYNEYEMAFGSADHNIYYYDIRNAKKAWECIRGHKKAISYVKFRNRYEFVSASTDNSLKLWSINPYALNMNNYGNNNSNNKIQLVRTYSGHTNERNFAGLSINKDGDFILCGSETNEIFVYYSEFERPTIVQNFGNMANNVTGGERDYSDNNQFISSLSFKKTSENIFIAANSEGRVKIFELG
ncbi:WD40 repeat-like protein [Piromyces finnis]|uniref:WD40 repeat-like protein n=1 Tax=Piromyces finnis TaxID=1754191 RepID=A0A1Y1V5V2_9FUNG|nr:WD40 repeat-like protein [Piromyces finnis]|eukprot:ORX47936.1 WD40 repeat-like protein [Piromyces finnis]